MDRSIAWRAGLLQALLVGVLAVVLGTALDRSFFVSWGWLAGPGAWGVAALGVATALRLAPLPVLAGAALAGVPSLAAVFLDAHWAGAPLAVALFALWCGRLGSRSAPLAAAA